MCTARKRIACRIFSDGGGIFCFNNIEGVMISEASKVLLFLMVVFLAGYLLAINDTSKKLTKGLTEGFDATEVVIKRDDNESDPRMIINRIDAVYKEVNGTNMPADKLRELVQTYDLKTYSDEAYRKMLMSELKSDHTMTVKNAFAQVLNRMPTPFELEKYVNLFMEKNLTTPEQLEALLSSGPEGAGVSVEQKKCVDAGSKDDFKHYQDITKTFESVLERQPTTQEMNYYHNLMTKGKLDESKLRTLLSSSREFDILSMNQQNAVQAPLNGALTSRQLEMIVTEIYTKVYGTAPDPPAFKYVMSKLVEFDADEQKLLIFLKNMKRLEDAAGGAPPPASMDFDKLPGNEPMWATSCIPEKPIAVEDVTCAPSLESRLMEKPQSTTGLNRNNASANISGTIETFHQPEPLKSFQAPPETSYIHLPLESKDQLPTVRVLKELDPVSIVYEDKPLLGNATALMKQTAGRNFDKDALAQALETTLEGELEYAPFQNNRNINQRNYDLVRQYDAVTTQDELWDDRFNVFAPLGYQNKKDMSHTAGDPLIPGRSI